MNHNKKIDQMFTEIDTSNRTRDHVKNENKKKEMYTILLLFRTIEREGERENERKRKIQFVYYWLISNIGEQRFWLVNMSQEGYYGY
jgi:hypothetical protein